MLSFKSSGHLTLGVEIELQLLDRNTLDLAPVALNILSAVDCERIKPEIFQSMLEINTGICADVHDVERDLTESSNLLRKICAKNDVLISSTGTHPFARYSERKLFPAERYHSLIDRNQWIARRLMIFGMHIHIGMRDGDSCIRFNNFFLHFIPHMLALTASSPFWQSEETGLASCRSTIFESCPTAGHPCRLKNWEEFSDLCDRLVRSQSITSLKDIWWDIRPSPDYGTLEIRACDGPATQEETLAVVAFIHALAHWFDIHADYDYELHAPHMWMMRENKWRVTRHGQSAVLILDDEVNTISLREDIALWMDRLHPIVMQLGYQKHWQALAGILERGSSYQRQLRVFSKTESLQAVAEHNAREFEMGKPIY